MERGSIKSKRNIIILSILVVAIIIGGIIFFQSRNNEDVSFDANDKLYFAMFTELFEPGEYEFDSLDAYYLSDTMMYYYNAKYTCYSPLDDTWYDVDEVTYGRVGIFYNSYCLSWDELYGFEEADAEFKRALKEGIHKSYTKEEIDDFLETAHNEKNNE